MHCSKSLGVANSCYSEAGKIREEESKVMVYLPQVIDEMSKKFYKIFQSYEFKVYLLPCKWKRLTFYIVPRYESELYPKDMPFHNIFQKKLDHF